MEITEKYIADSLDKPLECKRIVKVNYGKNKEEYGFFVSLLEQTVMIELSDGTNKSFQYEGMIGFQVISYKELLQVIDVQREQIESLQGRLKRIHSMT